MSAFNKAMCLVGRHRPISDKTKWSGGRYIGECQGCGKSIRRISHGRWRLEETKPHIIRALRSHHKA